MLLDNSVLHLLVASLAIISSFGSISSNYVFIPTQSDQVQLFSNYSAFTLDCFAIIDQINEPSSFLSNPIQNISFYPSLRCPTDRLIPADSFYLVKVDKIDQSPPEYICIRKEEFWSCSFTDQKDLNILLCNKHNLFAASDVYLENMKEKEVIATCIAQPKFKLYKTWGSELQVFLHDLFPLVQENIIHEGQIHLLTYDLGLNDLPTKCTLLGQEAQIYIQYEDGNNYIGCSLSSFTLPNSQKAVNISIEYNRTFNLKISFILDIMVIQEISGYFLDDDRNILFILAKDLPKSYSYYVLNKQKNTQVQCQILNDKNIRFPDLLICNVTLENLTSEQSGFFNAWNIILSENNKNTYSLPISFQKLSSDENFDSTLKIKSQYYESNPYPILIMELDSKRQILWLLQNKGPNIIECDFFMDHSTLGFLSGPDKIFCPIPKHYRKNPKGFFTKCLVQIHIDDFLHITIKGPSLENQTPSFPIASRLLLDAPYDFSPIDPRIITQPSEVKVDDSIINNISVLGAIFKLNAYSVALVTVDLRFLSSVDGTFNYGTDWDISFTIANGNSLNFEDLYSAPMPETFTRESYKKSAVHEFILIARVDLEFKVDILIRNDSFLNLRYAFLNSTSVEIINPYRAHFSEDLSFYAMINSDNDLSLPINLPELDAERNPPDYWLDLGSLRETSSLKQHVLEGGRNIFNPSSLYWGNSINYITMPYLPFFSNCKGFDKYIPIFSLFEQNSQCNLISPENTVYVTPFGFGSQGVGDSCSEIKLECIYDENIDSQAEFPRWFEEGPSLLFYLTKDPQKASVMDDDSFNIKAENFIRVTVKGDYEEDKVPSLVKVEFNYFQYSQTEKRLVSGKVTLDNFITPTDSQKAGTDPFPYSLEISLTPLGHTDLIIAFEFGWQMYMLLYVIIGLVMATYILVFFVYHFFMSRDRKKKVKIWGFVKLILPEAIKGIIFAVIPMVPIVIILAALMLGEIWDLTIHGCESKDVNCYRSVFDMFTLDARGITERNSKDFTTLRNGRAGYAFIVVGLVIIILSSQKFVKQPKKDEKVQEAYDGNLWLSNLWTRSALIFNCLLQSVMIIAIIEFSFTEYYGSHVFIFIGTMKIFGMMTQFVFDKILNDRMLFAPLLVVHGITEAIITFGATDFLDFLVGGFIDLAIQMIERAYAGPLIEAIVEYLDEKYVQAAKFLKRTLLDQESTEDSEEDDEDENESTKDKQKELAKDNNEKEKNSPENNTKKTPEKPNKEGQKRNSSLDESSDSNIILTNQDESINSSLSVSLLAEIDLDSDIDDSEDEFEKELKMRLAKKEREKQKQMAADLGMSANNTSELNDAKNEAVDTSFGFYVDTLALFFTPFFILLMWMFYDENKLGVAYDIAEEDFVFYFLFAVVVIPFQVLIDIWHYNIAEFYTSVNLFGYLEQVKQRFDNRKAAWKGDDDDCDDGLEEKFRRIDQFCFSSQFYFIVTIYSSGMLLIILGAIIMIAASYYVFEDTAAYYILATFIAITAGGYYLVLFIGKKLRIWTIGSESNDLSTENIRSEEVSLYDGSRLNVIFRKFRNWDNVEKVKSAKNRLQEVIGELQVSKLKEEEFKMKIMLENQYWFASNIEEMFTPTTLKKKRADIIKSFKDIYGDVSARAAREDHVKEITSSRLDFREKKGVKKNLSLGFIEIIRIWKMRASLIRKIRSQVAGIIECSTAWRCEICGTNYYLRAELVPNIETIFIKFLREDPSQNPQKWSIESWQEAFKKNALIRTLCFDCSTKITDHHIQTSVEETRTRRLNEKKLKIIMLSSKKEIDDQEGDHRQRHHQQKESPIETEESKIIEDINDEDDDEIERIKTNKKLIKGTATEKILISWFQIARARVKHQEIFNGKSLQKV